MTNAVWVGVSLRDVFLPFSTATKNNFMPERQNPSDAGMCQAHGNFLPCAVCEEAQRSSEKSENKTELGDKSVEDIKKELMELGIEATKENIETALELKNTAQFPEGYGDILDNLNDPEKLKDAMMNKGITAIVHAEGKTVWDHVRRSIELINSSGFLDSQKKDIALIMLYHDLGKTEVSNSEKNFERTKKNLEKGELHQAMIGHAEAGIDKIRNRLSANGVLEKNVEIIITVIKNHMQTSIADQDPKKTAALIDVFGQDEEERKKVVELLAYVLQFDGNATEHIELDGDKLHYSKNEKKLNLNFEAIWSKYEQGKEMIAKEEAEKQKKLAEADRELKIFGMKLSDYIKQRGVKPGPEMGNAAGKIKKIIADNSEAAPEDLKKMIDEAEL